jgi:hypothetical protein
LSEVKQSEVTADQIGDDGSTVKEAILKTLKSADAMVQKSKQSEV